MLTQTEAGVTAASGAPALYFFTYSPFKAIKHIM